MRKMLNTLYITTQGAWIFKDGESIAIKTEGKITARLPIHTIGGMVCFGQVTCSPYLLHHCAENGVGVSFLSRHGRFLARVQGPVSGNVLLRRQQYRMADNPELTAGIARHIVLGKLINSLSVLKRMQRDHPQKIETDRFTETINGIKRLIRQVEKEKSLDAIRGMEGKAANDYFSVFNQMITSQKEDFIFTGRNRRPPRDAVNALLSFVYTLLYHDACSALETVGLDPAVGFLHRDRPGRQGLGLDMMEELRSVFADRLALSLINLKKITSNGFKVSESGAVLMDDETRKNVIMAYQERKQDILLHPFINEKIPLGMVLFAQAQLLARYIRGDLDGYPPFIRR
ncbi:MAG: type I-C CRISPR-associated endonuclease Cas1 [Calditrichaeota bacterium]|nr:MAG: type I-C CRISPR-associated endonuclease Cas1 [Calditrichota bacterium]